MLRAKHVEYHGWKNDSGQAEKRFQDKSDSRSASEVTVFRQIQEVTVKLEMSGKAGNEVPGFREEVGNRLRELEGHFENRAAAAKSAGVSKSTFQDWVHGKRDPSFEGLARFAAAVGASLDWIAGLDTRRASQPPRGEQSTSDDTVPPLSVDAEIVEVAERELRRNEGERKINWITPGGRHAVFAKLIE